MTGGAAVASRGYAAMAAGGSLQPFSFERRPVGPDDVLLELTHCGICHSDVHFVNNDWGFTRYPLVPGHEIVGRVAEVGERVTAFSPGDVAAIGCFVDACRTCGACLAGEEQVCERRSTPTYGGLETGSGRPTYGGYSDCYVVDQHFVLSVPAALEPARAAPLLCAGITTYSPLRHWQVGPATAVGVVGLGGLGHMGVQLAKAMGARVTVFTTSQGKVSDALRLGADAVVLSTDRTAMRSAGSSLDFVLDTVSAAHDLNPLLKTLRRDGTLCLVGMPDAPASVAAAHLVTGRRRLAGSMTGGIAETQEMLDFCAAQGISAEVEVVGMAEVGAAYERMLRGDVAYRFVIDLATL